MISYPNYKSGLRLEIFISEGKKKTENTYFPFRAFFYWVKYKYRQFFEPMSSYLIKQYAEHISTTKPQSKLI